MTKLSTRQQKFLVALPVSWRTPLINICGSDYMEQLLIFLRLREAAGAKIYPQKKDILASLHATAFEDVKVVIVGQDPYHGPGQAHGLSFSVPPGIAIPPSLRNIFKELKQDLKIDSPKNGNLNNWAKQGVLLLNAILTVEAGAPAAHAGKGWELFTDEVIRQLVKRQKPLVIMLWGAYAQKKMQNLNVLVDRNKILILKAAHPSPLSVRGFLGCGHFSQANLFLNSQGLKPINWAEL